MVKMDIVEHGAVQLEYVSPAIVVVIQNFIDTPLSRTASLPDAGTYGVVN